MLNESDAEHPRKESYDLHSSELEYLGVVAGMKSWCKEFAERHKVESNFRNDVSSVVSFQLGVSHFRVLQEALHNPKNIVL